VAHLTLENNGPKTNIQLGDRLSWTYLSNTLQITRQGKRLLVDNGMRDDRTLLTPMSEDRFCNLATLIAAMHGFDLKLVRSDELLLVYELIKSPSPAHESK
jgi:hypothetical protein